VRLQALQSDLSAEYHRRLEGIEAEWAARSDARVNGGCGVEGGGAFCRGGVRVHGLGWLG